jgi:hypothetical protein
MRIFVGYAYHDRDAWIEKLVFDLIRAFGGVPVSGKEIYGQDLEEGVKQTIRGCDAVLAFLTRRDSTAAGKYTTHRWVIEEITTASDSHIPFLEVRETEVDEQGGMPGGRQHILYDLAQRDVCLVEIAKAIGKWRLNLPIKLQLLPDEVSDAIRPFLLRPGFRCSYQILHENFEHPITETKVIPIKGGLFVRVTGLEPLSMIQISVEAAGKRWRSDYESADSVSITLQEE